MSMERVRLERFKIHDDYVEFFSDDGGEQLEFRLPVWMLKQVFERMYGVVLGGFGENG